MKSSVRQRSFSRYLRRNQTDVEKLLWSRLRNGQINNLKFRRQCPLGTYIVDFVCLEKKLVIELDGGQHTISDNHLRDKKRTLWLQEQGFRVLRFWNNDVSQSLEGIIQIICDSLIPHPSPLPQGAREKLEFSQEEKK